MVATAKETLGSADIKVAAVATAFPSGRASLAVKLADTEDAVAAGADEIDMVIDRGAFLAGDYLTVFRQVADVKAVCGDHRLKVILETGELVTLRQRPSRLVALDARRRRLHQDLDRQDLAGDALPVTLVMLEAVRDSDHR